MGKHTVKSTTVNCPICGKECQTRGLYSHLRLTHPNADIKKELRKKIISPNSNNDKIIFQVSLDIYDNWKIKWANFTIDDIYSLQEIFNSWAEDGNLSRILKDEFEGVSVDNTSGVDPTIK